MEEEVLIKDCKRQGQKGEREKRPILLQAESSYLQAESSYGTADSMDPDLYRSVTEGDIIAFVTAIQIPRERTFGPPATCAQVSPQKNTILHLSTTFGHYEIAKIICKDLPLLVMDKNYKGDTALHIAAREGNLLLVSLLIEPVEMHLGVENDEGNTALHEALRYHHEDVSQALIFKDLDMIYSANKDGESVLYLAAEAGYANLVNLLMENPVGNYNRGEPKNKSLVHAAILGGNIDVLRMMWARDQASFYLRSKERGNPLHYAVSIGYLEGVRFLLHNFCIAAYERDDNGFYPIHIASRKGRIDMIQEFLWCCPDTRELLNQQGQNIVHIAARGGKDEVVQYLLGLPEMKQLINEKDDDGNTPLHLATKYQFPKIVRNMASDRRVRLNLVNNDGFTAFDIAEQYNEPVETMSSFRKRLTWVALKVANAPRAPYLKSNEPKFRNYEECPKVETYKSKVNVILLVSTLVATVTFTAGFTIPGGDNNSKPDQGIATMLMESKFHVFVVCNTIAMYSSVFVAVSLLWAQLGDLNLVFAALRVALPLLGLALSMMSIAFMAGLYLVVSKLVWLANFIFFMGLISIITLLGLFFPLCFIAFSNYYILRYVSYYPFRLMLFLFGSYTNDTDMEDLEGKG